MIKPYIATQHVLPQHILSRTTGWLAKSTNPLIKSSLITCFAKAYNISLKDYSRKQLSSYHSFNDFFTRELADHARPIDNRPNSIISPADGIVSQIGDINQDQIIQAKNHQYRTYDLLGDGDFAKKFSGGSFATIYLAPNNYHRVHLPLAATLYKTRYIPGKLFSVNEATAQNVPQLFARNERMVCQFNIDSTNNPPMALVMVGAMIVAGIETVATGKMSGTCKVTTQSHRLKLSKADEIGRFYLGSTAILLLPKSLNVDWSGINPGQSILMGKRLGTFAS